MEKPQNDAILRRKGIDVSNHNGVIDWQKVKASGVEFVFIKATEGGDWVDATFAANRKGARAAGLTVGYYHFFRPSTKVDLQVANFAGVVGELEKDALRPVLDVEDPRLWKDFSIKDRIAMILDWCQKVKARLGVTPMLYGSPNFIDTVLENAPELAAYDLWIANYNVQAPIVPKPWSKWTFWQHTDKGSVAGISGNVDLNWFKGNDLAQPRNKEGNDIPSEGPARWIFLTLVYCAVFLYFTGLATVIYEFFCK